MNWNFSFRNYFLVFAILFLSLVDQGYGQVELRYEQNETVSWKEAIRMYEWMDEQYEAATLVEAGKTDAGKALHLFIISKDQLFSPEEARQA